MSEESPPPPPPDPKPPLEYRNYSDDRPERKKNAGAFVGGMFPGIILISVCGFFNAIAHIQLESPVPFPEKFKIATLVVFGSIGIVAAMFGISLLRPPRRRFMLAGFLLGVALTCIIEGLCFFG
jgi:hypothetical protein